MSRVSDFGFQVLDFGFGCTLVAAKRESGAHPDSGFRIPGARHRVSDFGFHSGLEFALVASTRIRSSFRTWFKVLGLWFLVSGFWFMVHCVWCMVYGSWFGVYCS